MPVIVKTVTIIPAITTPEKMVRIDFLISRLNRYAIREAVQAPVKGKGIATKTINASSSYFSILLFALSLVLSNTEEPVCEPPKKKKTQKGWLA